LAFFVQKPQAAQFSYTSTAIIFLLAIKALLGNASLTDQYGDGYVSLGLVQYGGSLFCEKVPVFISLFFTSIEPILPSTEITVRIAFLGSAYLRTAPELI